MGRFFVILLLVCAHCVWNPTDARAQGLVLMPSMTAGHFIASLKAPKDPLARYLSLSAYGQPTQRHGVMRAAISGLPTALATLTLGIASTFLAVGAVFAVLSMATRKGRLGWGIYNIIWGLAACGVGIMWALGLPVLGLLTMAFGLVGIALGIACIVHHHKVPLHGPDYHPQDHLFQRIRANAAPGLSLSF